MLVTNISEDLCLTCKTIEKYLPDYTKCIFCAIYEAMDNTISLNHHTFIDLPTLLKTRSLVQANSGGGKSWLIRRILEQSQGKVQQIVIDLEGEFASLRKKFDYILVGKDGDTPADPVWSKNSNVSTLKDLWDHPCPLSALISL